MAIKTQRRPNTSRLMQQQLPAQTLIFTPKWVILTSLIIACVFIPVGIVTLSASLNVVEVVERYDHLCSLGQRCYLNVTAPKDMKHPVYIYYELDNFYQNHRKYLKSRNDKQLKSRESENETRLCTPVDESNPRTHASIVPCGLIAWSLFNDTYSFRRNGQQLTINKLDISWKIDRDRIFGHDVYPKNFQNGSERGGATLNESKPLSEQEDLIVWMRTAALPDFRKLYGKLLVDLKAGETIEVTVENNYNTYGFDGKKKLVLSTTTWLGGKNPAVGLGYLVMGVLYLLLALAFLLCRPRKIGDPSQLSWNRQKSN